MPPDLTLILRPDLGKKAYRLKCRFTIEAFPTKRSLELGKFKAAGLFVTDLAKQGWENVEKFGFKLNGPFSPVEIMTIPKRSEQPRWNASSKEMYGAIQSGNIQNYQRQQYERMAADGGYARPVPHITEVDSWEFELVGVFVHKTILMETPDPHEEEEELAW